MKPRSDITSSLSCSCTSCFYKSESERPSLRRFVAHGSKIDKLYVGKYLPLREEKLLNRLIRTRAVYDDIRTTLLSDHNDSDTANLKPTRHMPMRTRNEKRDGREYDLNERSSVLLELVSLIDRGAALPHRLSECCSCCVCGGSTIDRRNQRVHKHKHGPLSSLSSMTSGFRSRDQHRGSRHAYRAKNIQSDPCTCTSKTCKDEECDIKSLMKNLKSKGTPVFEQYEGSTFENKTDRRQKVKGYKTRPSGMGESLRRFKKSKESIFVDTKNKLRDQVKRRTKRYLNSEVRYSLRHKKSQEEEEEEVQEAIQQITKESLAKLKEEKRKLKEEKMRRNTDKGRGPYEGEKAQYAMEKEALDKRVTRHTGENVMAAPKSITAVQIKKHKVDKKVPKQQTEELNESNIQSKSDESAKSLSAIEKSSTLVKMESAKSMTQSPTKAMKKDKFVTQRPKEPAKRNFGSGGYALKRCFCTLKLKPRINKTRRKGLNQSHQTETSKTQSSATSVSQRIEKRGVNYTTTPSNTRKLKQSTKLTSKNLSNVSSGLLPYECEPGVCVPGECNPIECDKLIKKRDSGYAAQTGLKRHTQSISTLGKKSSRSSQTSQAYSSEKAMKTNEEWIKEKHIKRKDIPVLARAPETTATTSSETFRKGETKVGTQKHTAEGSSQIISLTKSKYSFTKHQLKRCFCTLKLSKKGKIQGETLSKGTLTSGISMSDMKEKPILRDKRTEKKETHVTNQFELEKNECEPGICIPDECDPYQCLELIKKRYITQPSTSSRHFKRKTKSTYSIARKKLAKSRTIQSVSSLQKNRNVSRGQNASAPNQKNRNVSRGQTASAPNQIVSNQKRIVRSPTQFASNRNTGNRQAVRIGSSFSFDIEFYKEKGDAKPVTIPITEPTKPKKEYDKNLQRRTKRHHKSTSMQTYTQDEGIITSSATKRCFCTLKLQKRGRNPATTSSTATETVMTKEMYPKVGIMVTRSTKMKRKDIQKLDPYECEPNFCVPGECDPYVCLKRIQTRDKVKSKDFGSGTENKYKKSTASITSSLISRSKNVLVKSDSGRIQKKRKRSKYTTSSSYSKVPITPNISTSRQAVHIGSNFSFSVEFFKNRTLDMPEEPIIVSSNKKIREVDRGYNTYRTSVNNSITQSVVKKANKGSWIQPILKRCFCTLKLQKNNNKNLSVNKPFNPVVMAAQIYNENNLQKHDIKQLKYISMKQSFGSRKKLCYRSNMLTSSIDTISDNWFNSNKSIVSSDMAYNMKKTLRHRRRSKQLINKDNIQNVNLITQSPFVKKSICAMNVYGIQRRTHKLEPYECEPGVCVPGECDPYQCQKLIMKRLTKRSSTMTASGNRSQSTYSGRTQMKTSEQQYGTRRRRKEKQKRVPQVISYKLPPAKSRKQAVRIGSTFSFDVEFFKNRSSASPQKTYQSPVSRDTVRRDTVRRRKGHSVGSSPYGRRLHDRGLRGSQVSYDTRPSQSGFMTQDVGVSIVPKSKRCFCTLELKKRGQMQVQVGHEAKPMRVPYVDAAQNTKKYNIPHLDPNECEPGVCVPGMCDPYECLERIKRRRNDSKEFGTGTNSNSVSCSSMICEKMKCPQGKCVQIGERNTRQRAEKLKPIKTVTTTEPAVRGPSASARQAVKIGSSFSFNVEFYKDRTAQERALEPVEPEPRAYSKPKRRKHYNQGTKQTTSSITRAIQDSTGLRHQDSQAFGPETRVRGTKTGAFLKRCFCTAKLFQKQHATEDTKPTFMQRCFCTLKLLTARRPSHEPPPKLFSDASNQTVTYKEKPQRMPKLEPYECEPGVCIPGECNPIVCAERIKKRNRAAKLSTTDFGETRSTSTTFREFRPTRSIGSYARERKEKQPKERRAVMKYRPAAPVKLSSEPPLNRNAVKIGSNFSFNVEFYKIKYPAIQRAAREVKERRVHRSSTSSQLSQRKLRDRGVSKRRRLQSRAQGSFLRRGERGTGALKRCFCTLALQADYKDTNTQGTDTPYYRTYPKLDDKNTLTKPYKLLPYECEPGFCVPGECDPYECLKHIKRRREYGTSTNKRGTSSTSTLMRQRQRGRDRNVQSRREKKENARKIQRPSQMSESQRQHKQAVKIGSTFSFNVEFSKSKSGSQVGMREPEAETVRTREPRMAKYRTNSTYGRPEKRMSTMSTSQDKYLRDTDSQAARNMRSALTETKPFLKRCFCTLQFKNSANRRQVPMRDRRETSQRRISPSKYRQKQGTGIGLECRPDCIKRQRPINVYMATVNSKLREYQNNIVLNSKAKKPGEKRSSRQRNCKKALQIVSNLDFDDELLNSRAKTNPFYTHSPYVYPTFVSQRGPVATRAVKSKTRGGILAGWNVGPLIRRCSVKLQKNGRLQGLNRQKLEPFECEPNVCVPGECDPYACYERIQRRNMRNTGTNGVYRNLKSTSSFAGNKSTQVKNLQSLPKQTYAKKSNNVQRNKRRMSNIANNQDRHACRVGSSFSFNIEFYKDRSPPSNKIDSSYPDHRQRKRTYSRRNTITNTNTTNRRVATDIDDVRDKCMQAKCVRRDISLSIKPLLQRCFCTLKLQTNNKINTQREEIKPQTQDKSVVANFKHRVMGMLLDPNECEPGVCVPGECNPYECLERIQKRNLINRSTDAPRCNKVCQQTSAAFGPISKTKKIQYKATPTRDSAIVETPRIPFIQPEYWNGVRFGSNIKCSVEFYKDYCVRPDAKDKIAVNTKMAGDSNINEPRFAQRYNQTYRPMPKCNKAVCPKQIDGTMQTRINTDDKSSVVEKALKRCFCTAKLQNMGRKTTPNNVIVGRVDNLITNSPFQPNKFEIYRMQKKKGCAIDPACNEMETILPYAPNKFKKTKSKTSMHRKGILKKDKCKCCKKVCNDICIERTQSANSLTAKQEKLTFDNPHPVKSFFCRFINGSCKRVNANNIQSPEIQFEESQKDPKKKPKPLCKDCMNSSKNKKKTKKRQVPAPIIPAVEIDDVDEPCKNCIKNKYCKCLFCKCPFCKYNAKRKAKDVTCRTCKKHLNTRDFPLICAHCGTDFNNEEKTIQPAVKPFTKSNTIQPTVKPSTKSNTIQTAGKTSKKSIKKLNNDVKQGNGYIKSSSQNKTNPSKENVNKKECADTCTGIKKKKQKKIKEGEENNCSDECKGKKRRKLKSKKQVKEKKQPKSTPAPAPPTPAPPPPEPKTCPETCLLTQPHGFKLTKVGQYEMPPLHKRKPPCVCGSRVCATKSFKERFPKKTPKLPEECKCGSSVCAEEFKKIKEIKAEELKQKESEEKDSEAKKDEAKKSDEQKKKDELKKRGANKKSDAKKAEAKKKKSKKVKEKEKKAKEKKDKKMVKKKAIQTKKKKLQSKKEKISAEKKKKQHIAKLKKHKKLETKKAAKLKAKRKKELKEMHKRRKIYNKEDKLRRKKRRKLDKFMLARVKKTQHRGDCALLTESIVDIGKLGCETLGDILRSAYRTATDPKNTYYNAKLLYSDPALACKHAKDAVVYSGIGSTFKRVKLRVSMMQKVKALKEKIESYQVTHTLFHMFDKNPPKFRKRRKLRVKEPIDFDCSPFMGSLRKRPWLSIWYTCPWFYPHCLSLLTVWRQFTDIILFLLAVVVWSPCLFLWEALRALMCCTMCTA